jgi:uncharacterized protein YaiE (UPF0345 family)
MEDIEIFRAHKPNVDELRREYCELDEFLTGEFIDRPNVYELAEGTVVSWELQQGRAKNPTHGGVPEGHYEFDTGEYAETLIFLCGGKLETVVNGKKKVLDKKYDSVVVPANTTLHLEVIGSLVKYLCLYEEGR